MIYLEFKNEQSHKFWSVELQGTKLCLSWGKVGTRGQTKTRAFDSIEAAQKEQTRLIKAKEKKGYQSQTPSSDPVSSSHTLPAQKSQDLPPDIAWKPNYDKLCRPKPQGAFLPPPAQTPQSAWKKAQPDSRDTFLSVQGMTPELEQILDHLRDNFLGSTPLETPEIEPAAIILCLNTSRYWVDYFVMTRGMTWTLAALYKSFGYFSLFNFRRAGGLELHTLEQPHRRFYLTQDLSAVVYKSHLASLTQTERSALVDLAAEHVSDRLTALLGAWLFPEAPWVENTLQDWLQSPLDDNTFYWNQDLTEAYRNTVYAGSGWVLWPQNPSETIQERYLKLSPDSGRMGVSQWMATQFFPMIKTLGAGAAPTLAFFCRHAHYAAERKTAAQALSCIRTPEAYAQMLALMDHKVGQQTFSDILENHPYMTLQALAQGSPKALKKHKDLLIRLYLAHKAQWPEWFSTFNPEQQVVLSELLPRSSDLPDCFPEALKALVNAQLPEWPELELPDIEPEIVFWPEDVVYPIQPYIYYKPPMHAKDDAKQSAKMKKALEKKEKLFLDETDRLSRAGAVAYWNQSTHQEWYNPEHSDLLSLLKRLGLAALPGFINFYKRHKAKGMALLTRIKSPELSPLMYQALWGSQPVQSLAWKWCLKHPDCLIQGLLHQAPDSPETQAALIALKQVPCFAQHALLRHVPQGPVPFPHQQDLKPPPLPPLRLKTQEAILSESGVQALLKLLKNSSLYLPHPHLADFKSHLDPDSLSSFVWALFQDWLQQGALASDAWCFYALAHLGNATTVQQLQPLIQKWPKDKKIKRAQWAIEVLAQMPHPSACLEVQHLSQNARYASLKEVAQQALTHIALRENLSPEQLADQLLPDFCLNSQGVSPLGDSGFALAISPDFKPALWNASKQGFQSSFPKNLKEGSFKQAWKTFKSNLKKVLTTQTRRLEKDMVSQTLWSLEKLQTFYLQHPVMRPLLRSLIWGVPGDKEAPYRQVFCWGDQGPERLDKTPLSLGQTQVVIAHPVYFQQEVARWQTRFQDRQQVFPQLKRRVQFLHLQDLLTPEWPMKARPVQPQRLLGAIKKGRWEIPPDSEGEVAFQLGEYEGLASLDIQPWSLSQATSAQIYQVALTQDQKYLSAHQVPPHIFSEVAYELHLIRA